MENVVIGLTAQFVALMGKRIVTNVIWKLRHARLIQILVDGIMENVENVFIAMMEGRIPKDVFQNVVLHVAAGQKILKDAFKNVEMIHISEQMPHQMESIFEH